MKKKSLILLNFTAETAHKVSVRKKCFHNEPREWETQEDEWEADFLKNSNNQDLSSVNAFHLRGEKKVVIT